MSKKDTQQCCEKMKTMIGGQALIEGIMMRGPEKDAIVIRVGEELKTQVTDRKVRPKSSPLSWPFIRGVVNFFDAQVTGVKALMHSAEYFPEEEESNQEPSKFEKWLEKHLGDEKFQKLIIGASVVMGIGLSVVLFFLIPMVIAGLFSGLIQSNLVIHLIEGVIRIAIFMGYLILVSRMKDMKRVFSYHGAEHKTIRCYEAGLPLTVENVRQQTRLHPRCGTSFLLIIMIISILVFTVASSGLLEAFPALAAMQGTFLYRLVMILFKLLLLPLVVSVTYEINRLVGRYDNAFTGILTAPGMWMQNFTTNEPDDSMIEVGIAAVQAVLPSVEGADRW